MGSVAQRARQQGRSAQALTYPFHDGDDLVVISRRAEASPHFAGRQGVSVNKQRTRCDPTLTGHADMFGGFVGEGVGLLG